MFSLLNLSPLFFLFTAITIASLVDDHLFQSEEKNGKKVEKELSLFEKLERQIMERLFRKDGQLMEAREFYTKYWPANASELEHLDWQTLIKFFDLYGQMPRRMQEEMLENSLAEQAGMTHIVYNRLALLKGKCDKHKGHQREKQANELLTILSLPFNLKWNLSSQLTSMIRLFEAAIDFYGLDPQKYMWIMLIWQHREKNAELREMMAAQKAKLMAAKEGITKMWNELLDHLEMDNDAQKLAFKMLDTFCSTYGFWR